MCLHLFPLVQVMLRKPTKISYFNILNEIGDKYICIRSTRCLILRLPFYITKYLGLTGVLTEVTKLGIPNLTLELISEYPYFKYVIMQIRNFANPSAEIRGRRRSLSKYEENYSNPFTNGSLCVLVFVLRHL